MQLGLNWPTVKAVIMVINAINATPESFVSIGSSTNFIKQTKNQSRKYPYHLLISYFSLNKS